MIIFLLCILIHFSIMSSGLSNEFHQYSPMLKDAINNCSITEAKNIADKSIQDVRNIIDNLKLDKKTVQDLTDYAFSLFYQLGRLHMTNELSNRVQTQPQKTLKSNTNPSIANQNLQSLLTQVVLV